MEAARQIDEWKILSKKIESTRMVPVFAPKPAGLGLLHARGMGGDHEGGRAAVDRGDRRRPRPGRVRRLQDHLRPAHVGGPRPARRPAASALERLKRLGTAELAGVAEQIHRLAQTLLSGSEWATSSTGRCASTRRGRGRARCRRDRGPRPLRGEARLRARRTQPGEGFLDRSRLSCRPSEKGRFLGTIHAVQIDEAAPSRPAPEDDPDVPPQIPGPFPRRRPRRDCARLRRLGAGRGAFKPRTTPRRRGSSRRWSPSAPTGRAAT